MVILAPRPNNYDLFQVNPLENIQNHFQPDRKQTHTHKKAVKKLLKLCDYVKILITDTSNKHKLSPKYF